MYRIFVIIAITLFSQECFSQANSEDSVMVEILVGDSLVMGDTFGAVYQHLDYYRKTRWTGNETPYDTATGNGFYQSFFTSGDFNIEELSTRYVGKAFLIIGLEILKRKNTGEDMYVVYLQGPDPNSVIWVDFYEAVDASEIKFIRK